MRVVIIVFFALLTACSSARQYVDVRSQERTAIEDVINHLKAEGEKNKHMDGNGGWLGTIKPKALFERDYKSMLDIDVSACPEDFRTQYWRTVESVRQLKNDSNDDHEQGLQNLSRELQELKAVARKYNADAAFGISPL